VITIDSTSHSKHNHFALFSSSSTDYFENFS